MFSVAHLNTLRAAEIERIAMWFPPGARVLEIGAGTGRQAVELARRGFSVEVIEMADSRYAEDRLFPIVDYDGATIPFADSSFDIVFSSSVLEHVPDLAGLHAEIRRVLRPEGHAVHVVPRHAWRFWSTVSAFPLAWQQARADPPGWWKYAAEAVRQHRHGERGNLISETWLFRPGWWRRNFRENGFDIVRDAPMGLFYTGNMIFAERWPLERRARLAKVLGSAVHIFDLRPGGRR